MKEVSAPPLLATALQTCGLAHIRVLEFPDGTRSAADAAAAIGCDVSDIGKSLVFMTSTKRPVLIIMNGAERVDEDKVSRLLGSSIRKADANEVRTATGYAIGGVPPFGHANPVETVIDHTLLGKKEIWVAAGTPKTVFRLTPDELRRATGVGDGVVLTG